MMTLASSVRMCVVRRARFSTWPFSLLKLVRTFVNSCPVLSALLRLRLQPEQHFVVFERLHDPQGVGAVKIALPRGPVRPLQRVQESGLFPSEALAHRHLQ